MTTQARAVGTADYGLILACVLLGSGGQVLMRAGMASLSGGSVAATVLNGMLQPLVMAGLACYAASTVLWLVVLSRVPLSIAYPFGALNYVIVVGVALATGEVVTALRWLGVLLIMSGIVLVSARGIGEKA